MNSTILILVLSLGFLAVSKSILIASGKAPMPKPILKKTKVFLYILLFTIGLLFIAGVYFQLYIDGFDFDFL